MCPSVHVDNTINDIELSLYFTLSDADAWVMNMVNAFFDDKQCEIRAAASSAACMDFLDWHPTQAPHVHQGISRGASIKADTVAGPSHLDGPEPAL
jgi:hypothetical protein